MELKSLMRYLLKEELDEAIRSKPGKKFKMNDLKRLKGIYEMHKYAQENLIRLGVAGSRTLYILSPNYVLKLAGQYKWGGNSQGYIIDYAKGTMQNRNEAKASTLNQTAITQQYDPAFNWIIVELKRPIPNDYIYRLSLMRSAKSNQDVVV